jgi:hypothetical protein
MFLRFKPYLALDDTSKVANIYTYQSRLYDLSIGC